MGVIVANSRAPVACRRIVHLIFKPACEKIVR